MTVTLGAPKLPLVFPPADSHGGDLVIADIGIPMPVFDELEGDYLELLTRERMRELVPSRPADSHKGDFGRVLVIAGSLGRTGAAHLAATGALRSGAGLVTIATPRSCVPIIAAMAPEYMTEPLDETPSGTVDYAAVDRVLDIQADVIAVGPGLGQSPGTSAFVQSLIERAGVPLVLDADALNAFVGEPERLMGRDGVDVIITPHPGELARLMGLSIEELQNDRLKFAREFAASHKVHVILKGHRTLVAGPDGRTFVNLTGNAGMATGGTGDLLTGMVAAWFAQLLDAEAASKLAVYLHGTAGDLAEADEGEVALIASRHCRTTRRRGPRAHRPAQERQRQRHWRRPPPRSLTTRPMDVEIVETADEAATSGAGQRLGETLAPGAVVLLTGQLGAGKTAFVRGIALGLGASPDDVSSPTFTLIQEYRGGRHTLHHVDLYRLNAIEVADLGLDELISGDDVVADRVGGEVAGTAGGDAIEVSIADEGEDRRRIRSLAVTRRGSSALPW